jgi:hypothetical protein
VDRSSWKGAVSGLTAILPEHVDALSYFSQATDWQVIYGVNMARNTLAGAADEAAYVSAVLGAALRAWEIGNEPDLYSRLGYRRDSWTYEDYLKEWRAQRNAMREASPGVPFSGPATAFAVSRIALPFAEDEGSRVALLTQHFYRGDGEESDSTLELLLEPDPNLQSELSVSVEAAVETGIPQGMRYAECNSFFNGGKTKISNASGTAFWAMDFMFTCAVGGCTGVNFHGGGRGPGYTPIADDDGVVVEARPAFYGLLMFTRAGPGLPIGGTVTTSEKINSSARGIERRDGGFNAILINKDDARSLKLNVATGSPATGFDPLWLRGGSLAASTGQILGGAPVSSDGTWAPKPQGSLSAGGALLNALLPPASAVLLRSL